MRISKALWQGALLALVACGSAASLAQDAVQAEARQAPARPFIERSLVIAPEQVGKFTLYSMNDYPGQPGAGIQVRYRHDDFPDVRVDLFVYPAGRVERTPLLDRAMRDLRQSLEYAVKQGNYSGLEFGTDGEFDLRRVDSDGSLRAPDEEATPAADAPDLDAVLVAASNQQDYRVGRLLEARLRMGEEAMESHGYLFYRGLYLVKGRISATPLDLPGEAFARFTQFAMATLVPAITARSTGGCAHDEIIVDPDAKDASQTLVRQLVASAARDEQEQCAEQLDETVPAGHRALPLVFDPDMWAGEG